MTARASGILSRIEKVLLLAGFLVLLGVAASKLRSFDLFWQLQSGKYMLQTHQFIHRDIFSLALNAPRFEHSWLHDVIFYLVYVLSGYVGLSLFKGLLISGTAVILAAVGRVRGASWASILLLLFPAVILTNGAWLARPQLWTFLIFALFLLILERYRKKGGRVIWWTVALMVLWANLHAAAILAFPILAAYLAGEGLSLLFRRSKALTRRSYATLWLVLVLLLGATMVTPYGNFLLRSLVNAPKLGGHTVAAQKTQTAPSPQASASPSPSANQPAFANGIGEDAGRVGPITQIFNMDWRRVSFWRDPGFFVGIGLAAALLLLGWRRLTPTDLFLLTGLVLMGFKLYRHTPFFFLAAGALLPVYLDAAVQPVARRVGENHRNILRATVIVAAIAFNSFLFSGLIRDMGFFQPGLERWHYPVAAAEFVRENHLPANLYNTYEWGGYLMWTLYPQYQVFWDGRSDSVPIFADGLKVSSGEDGWEEVLDRFNVKTLVLCPLTFDLGGRRLLLDRLRDNPRWPLVFADDSALVFVRADSVDPGWLQVHHLPSTAMDETVLAEANLLLKEDRHKINAYREMARVYLRRKELVQALHVLETYLSVTPRRDPEAEYLYRKLYPLVEGGPAPPSPRH